MKIWVSRIHFPIHALGPGRRVGIWLQGCSLHCKGCISADTWEPNKGETTTFEVLANLQRFLQDADGITISGGEPFEQPAALHELLTSLKSKFLGDVLVYSGYEYEGLQQSLNKMHGLIDALITGPFIIDEPQTLPWRGSDNQKLYCLTDLGKARFLGGDDPQLANFKSMDIMFDETSTLWMAGIPARDDVDKLVNILKEGGYQASSTSDLRG